MVDTTRLHLIGGFLGSGKTTAIINAAKMLMEEGKLVGVVTNDQGKYLVDTAFFKRENLPVVEVGGGCFCCNYADLEKQILSLKEGVHPDVIFAESVGSCSDLVATVIKPLVQLKNSPSKPSSFSVFTDARLLRSRLLGLPLPFSENVEYIFDEQVEEANLMIINKIDLISPENQDELKVLAQKRYPEKTLLLQNSLDQDSILPWLKMIQHSEIPLPNATVDVDYQRYSEGEMKLAWLDEEVQIDCLNGQGSEITKKLLRAIIEAFDVTHTPIGHLKFLIEDNNNNRSKISFTNLPDPGWESELPELDGNTLHLTINARAEVKIELLQEIIEQSLHTALEQTLAFAAIVKREAFHPNKPKPTHRIIG